VGEALGVGLALGDREAVAVREEVTDIVREGEREGEGLGDTMQVGTVRQDEQEARWLAAALAERATTTTAPEEHWPPDHAPHELMLGTNRAVRLKGLPNARVPSTP